jgi:hypothetical protein
MQASTELSSNNTMLNEEQELEQHDDDNDNDHNFDANELLKTFRQSFSTVNCILGTNLNHLDLSAASCELYCM